MSKAVELGRKGMNRTSPNPRVGCVIVKDGKILGKGYHRYFGGEHAEINAIENASEDLTGSVMYVTLEPCSHQGKTPPCVERIIKANIGKVVFALSDPDPGIEGEKRLKGAGVDVKTGVLEEAAREITADYLIYKTKKRPMVTLKSALSWDGKIASFTGKSQWITGPQAREFAMKMRGEHSAVMVGARTVLNDDPALTYRLKEPGARDPLRVILDGNLSIPEESQIIGKNTLIIAADGDFKEDKAKIMEDKGARVIRVETDKGVITAHKVLEILYSHDISSVMIEGGGQTAGIFLDEGFIDRVVFIHGPCLMGGREAPTACDAKGASGPEKAAKLINKKYFEIGEDLIMQAEVEEKCSRV